jgi:hypothetical protein
VGRKIAVHWLVDNREPWSLSYSPGWVGRAGWFGFSSGLKALLVAENLYLRPQLTGAATQAPGAAAAQWGPTALALCQSMVCPLVQFASYREARDATEVASKRPACFLVLAIKSAAPKEW